MICLFSTPRYGDKVQQEPSVYIMESNSICTPPIKLDPFVDLQDVMFQTKIKKNECFLKEKSKYSKILHGIRTECG
jgi:hypothetical protein